MPKSVVLIHTVPPLIDVFTRLGASLLPTVRMFHVLDEPLLEQVRLRGGLVAADGERLAAHVAAAAQIGASAVLVTCSTVSPAVDDIRSLAAIPVVKVDEAMIAAAIQQGTVIGVVATNQTTLAPTQQLLEQAAARAGKTVQVKLVLVRGALPALLQGDGPTHDRLVKAAILALAQQVEAVVLAQASTARVLDILPANELEQAGASQSTTGAGTTGRDARRK